MKERDRWENLEKLGEGGQSTVYLVRTPERVAARSSAVILMARARDEARHGDFANAVLEYAREDKLTELGALKEFDKIKEDRTAPEKRLEREIEILREGHPNLPRLIDANLNEQWMVTEYFPNRSLDKSPNRFKGEAALALKALRPLVQTVALLHEKKIVHRDIKPHNIFIANDGKLILGDFGIAFRDDGEPRATVTQETVGPGDYMPPWGEGGRLDEVRPSFDLYMLGKLLWCMISGRLKLQREWHREPENDLPAQFPEDRMMPVVNSILDLCLAQKENRCIQSAEQLLSRIDDALSMHRAGHSVDQRGNITVSCMACGRGVYEERGSNGETVDFRIIDRQRQPASTVTLRIFRCNICTHVALFAPTYPESAAARLWKPQ